ncbi:neurogenic locus notch homolog protein 1-like [Mya arenaria]|uniref:neurogenic locus notch homolog protein 1-like n=1 Tax=Mya arenaria TaxID=6604 RepID=UPI0022E2E1FE|nr:neurogenic locus notch homolog protein 1-like [Mya arenaria]
MESKLCQVFFIFTSIFGLCMCLVRVEVNILQYDNPLGTSYTGRNETAHRKCCDTGGSSCFSGNDTCDVYFTFCIGRTSMDPAHPGCKGLSMETSKNVSYDVFRITHTRSLKTVGTMDSWTLGNTSLMIDILDVDELGKGGQTDNPAIDLIDTLARILTFSPDPSYWKARPHRMTFTHHVSVDLELRVWCEEDWYGRSCDQRCNVTDDFHVCDVNGTKTALQECTDGDVLVLTLKEPMWQTENRHSLTDHVTRYVAETSCPPNTQHVNVTILDMRSNGMNADVLFHAYCADKPVSSLKFRQGVYTLNLVDTRISPPKTRFGVDVDSPSFTTRKQTGNPSIIAMVRVVKFTTGNTSDFVSLAFKLQQGVDSTSWLLLLRSVTDVTDCNGRLADVSRDTNVNTSEPSTALFLLTRHFTSITVEIKELSQTVAVHSFNTSSLVIGKNFLDAFPHMLPESTVGGTSLTIEVLSWCANCHHGNQCESNSVSCDPGVTLVNPSCSAQVKCENGGSCVGNEACACAHGWFGPTCSVDVDQCSLGACQHADTCDNQPGSFNCTCSPGFIGEFCDVDIDECTSYPCRDGSVCLNTLGSYACVCVNGTIGQNCGGLLDFCLSDPCSNGGTCSSSAYNFTCTCTAGWTGSTCQGDIDECQSTNICQNGGTCLNTDGSYTCQCLIGYTGGYCESDVNECLNNTFCFNNGSCNNTNGGFSCDCLPGFNGTRCEMEVHACVSNPCMHGQCTEHGDVYSCSCNVGWEGNNCDQDMDECQESARPCLHGGQCINTIGSYKCTCTAGWTGNHCESDVDECTRAGVCGNGKCINNNGSFSCNCGMGWTGDACDHDVDECTTMSPCYNNATCHNTNGSYTCTCSNAWTGLDCSNDVDDCLSSPCVHGLCNNLVGGFNCSCSRGWTGITCDTDINECRNGSVCENAGTCNNTLGSFNCTCPSEYTGDTCSVDINECLTGTPCNGHGACINEHGGFSCNCSSAWKGPNCAVDADECIDYGGSQSLCSSHGACVNTHGGYECQCVSGYRGSNCSNDVDECHDSAVYPCYNNGKCINTMGSFHCNCNERWTGDDCSTDVNECTASPPCLNGGNCTNSEGGFDCACATGWEGQTCIRDIDECDNTPFQCKNGATCVNSEGSFSCECANGWSGPLCSENIDDCENVTCANGGQCEDRVNAFMCFCAPGFEGRYCKVNMDECASNPCLHGGLCSDHINYYQCACPGGWEGTQCEKDVDECRLHRCGSHQACTNNQGSYTCTGVLFTTTTTAPSIVDVFSLEFVGPVTEEQFSSVQSGIEGVLRTITCRDSTSVHVSIVKNSVQTPSVIQFHARCDGHHLSNAEVNDAIHSLSQQKLNTFFPNMQVAAAEQTSDNKSWFQSHLIIVAGAGGGGVVLLVVIVAVCVCKRKKQGSPGEDKDYSSELVERDRDFEGRSSIKINNPLYNTLYPLQTES